MKIAKDLTELIGNTPLVKINKITDKNILAKLERLNPAGSVKDRPALNMIEQAEKDGLINKDTIIIEPTSGNTGIGLAMVCAIKGYKMILTMPETMTIERRKVLKAYGAEIVLTEGAKGMQGAVDKALELSKQYPNSFIPQQFENPANPAIHEITTAKEILEDTDGKIDIIIAGVGTGGTISGCAKGLKKYNPAIKAIAVEPLTSQVLSGKPAGKHKLQGIGANFVPKNYDANVIDEIFAVSDKDAFETARKLASQEGILCGITSGAAMYAAIQIANRPENKDKTVVVILPDLGDRYLSGDLFE